MHGMGHEGMHFGKHSEGLSKPINTPLDGGAHGALPMGKQQIKFIVEEKAQGRSEMPFSTSFHVHQEMIYRQVSGMERDSRYEGTLKPATPRTEICTLSLG